MAMGKRRRHAKQASMWVATQDLPRSAVVEIDDHVAVGPDCLDLLGRLNQRFDARLRVAVLDASQAHDNNVTGQMAGTIARMQARMPHGNPRNSLIA
jgi:hypothetical protein